MERRHETNMPYCWCKPEQEVQNGNILIIHRCDDCGETKCKCNNLYPPQHLTV